MIINQTQENPATLSNVGSVNSFAIKATAKSFQILSSGLYANKIRAFMRELSCNAYDSHVAAGCPDVPFEVHLPSTMEPWFSVRDYGVGLSHAQVVNIYTTYFESTKTNSNDFIGALGLGSKSPFSYTDNFTVTAVQNGIKGVYTAFINDQGVPSIAQMCSEPSEDRNGVEVKFAVADSVDFSRFQQEARNVFRWFKLKPTVTGVYNFVIPTVDYDHQDIIPGVHVCAGSNHFGRHSFAVMGNIAYPIDMPNPQTNLGELCHMLSCGLVLNFDIGELDFQASREGLSYVPSTIQAIRSKLQALSEELARWVERKVAQVPNAWQRHFFLCEQMRSELWKKPVCDFVAQNPQPWILANHYGYDKPQKIWLKQTADQHNVKITQLYRRDRYQKTFKTLSALSTGFGRNPDESYYDLVPSKSCMFVLNDVKTGAQARSKYHFNKHNFTGDVWILSAADDQKPADFDGFLKMIHQPPEDQIIKASNMDRPPRAASMNSGVTVMRLVWDGRRHYRKLVWREAELLTLSDTTQQYHYVPLNGFELISANGTVDCKKLVQLYENITGKSVTVYGVRKKDLKAVAKLPNWINFEHTVVDYLNQFTEQDLYWIALQDHIYSAQQWIRYAQRIQYQLNDNSLFKVRMNKYSNLKINNRINLQELTSLSQMMAPSMTNPLLQDYKNLHKNITQDFAEVAARYPLLNCITESQLDLNALAEYINLIDQTR